MTTAQQTPTKHLFRTGSTKAELWNRLKTGKPVPQTDLFAIIAAAGKTRQLLVWVLRRATESGYLITRDRNADTITVTRMNTRQLRQALQAAAVENERLRNRLATRSTR